jgi:glutamine amidotransferase
MSRRLWAAYASEQGLLEAALGPERLTLQLESAPDSPVGWGIGFYERGEPLVRKRPREDRATLDLLGVVAETRSDLIIGHVREPTVGDLRSGNTHPFRFRHWLMAHSGTIRRIREIEGTLKDAMPAFLLRSIEGDTDSEIFFHLVLAFLHDARELDKPRIAPAAVASAMVEAVTMIDELERPETEDERSCFDVIASNGAFLVVLRRSPIALLHRTYMAPGRGQVRARAVLVACARTAVGDGWVELPDRSTLTVDRDLAVETTAF